MEIRSISTFVQVISGISTFVQVISVSFDIIQPKVGFGAHVGMKKTVQVLNKQVNELIQTNKSKKDG